ncbi:opioid-binding protein/cell adhesion molecule isoform X2 [Oryzias latipes]
MCNSLYFIILSGLFAVLVFPGVPVRSGDSVLKDNIAVRQGDSAVLKCSVDSKVSRVAWLNRTTILFAGKEKWSLDPRVILLENTAVTEYSIKIQNVNVHDEGPYVCSILTNKKPKSTKVHLFVQVPARITNITKDVTVNEGRSISLICLAVGRPEASVVWRHHSPRGIYTFVAEGQHLELAEITKEQSGSYECIASNDISDPDIRTVQVTVNYPPFISKARSTGTSVGQKGVLQCEASAVPRPDFEWYKEDRRLLEPVPTTEGHRLFNGLNGVKIENQGKQSLLIFFNVSEEDYGNYTCVAMNLMGISNASIILYDPSPLCLAPDSTQLLSLTSSPACLQKEIQDQYSSPVHCSSMDSFTTSGRSSHPPPGFKLKNSSCSTTSLCLHKVVSTSDATGRRNEPSSPWVLLGRYSSAKNHLQTKNRKLKPFLLTIKLTCVFFQGSSVWVCLLS